MQKVDREFTSSLVSLIRKIRMAIDLHQDLLDAKQSPAELLTSYFDGIKVIIYLFCIYRFPIGTYFM